MISIPSFADSVHHVFNDEFSVYKNEVEKFRFLYPCSWTRVATSGTAVFYRNPDNFNESLFVEVSAPLFGEYVDIKGIGNPQEAAEKYLGLILQEFMSTRLGIRREAQVISALSRRGF